MTRASLDKQPADVAAMFDRTAERYDLLNGLMTGGQDRRWRHAVVAALGARPGEHILDLAAGTGTSSAPFVAAGAQVVACDFSLGMLRVGVRRREGVQGPWFVAGDALRLPFRDASFDAVTISFGLRNVADTALALRELYRVTRPEGRLLVCEVSHPPNSLLRRCHRLHLEYGLPLLAKASSNPDSYRYLAESIQAWPDQRELSGLLRQAGWEKIRWRNLSFGAVALHHAVKA
jgi:demethylmenaquinone methyltransferase / 2-methoxy-6-polyprenyl-1,4-benzoquinol methylase